MKALNNPLLISRDLAKLGRPQNVVYPGFLSVITVLSQGANWSMATTCYILLICLYAIVTTYNNIRDVKVDVLNNRNDNPIANSTIGSSDLTAYLIILLSAIGLCNYFLSQPASLVLSTLYLFLGLLYSHPWLSIQSKGIFAPILLATCYGVIPVLLGAAQARISALIITAACLQLPLLVPLLLAKDYKDEHGDRKVGKNTLLVQLGKTRLLKLVKILLVIECFIFIFASIMLHNILIIGLGFLIIICTLRVHVAAGKVSPYFSRIPQLALLLLHYQFITGL